VKVMIKVYVKMIPLILLIIIYHYQNLAVLMIILKNLIGVIKIITVEIV